MPSGERSVAMAGAMSEGGGAAALVAVSACPERVVPAARMATSSAARAQFVPVAGVSVNVPENADLRFGVAPADVERAAV